MREIRREIARVVEQHLEEILDRVMQAYRDAIPSVASAGDAVATQVRAATRRSTLSFLALYADPDSPARPILDEARRATTDRAGENFSREDIAQMIRIAAQVIFQSAREFVGIEIGEDQQRVADSQAALDAFLDEIQRPDHPAPPAGDAVWQLLMTAEVEEPDIT